VYRSNNCGLINAGTRDALIQAKKQHGARWFCEQIHFNESLSFPAPTSGLPEAFETDVVQAYAAGGIADERLAALLRLSSDDALRRVRDAGVETAVGELSEEEFEELLGG
jgi:hypothetical protein